MKVVTLVENTAASPHYKAVHGLSFYVETPRHKLLMDVGPGPQLLYNADALGIDLSAVDTVIISHGHDDHGGGLQSFLRRNNTAKVYLRDNAFTPTYSMVEGVSKFLGLDPALQGHPQLVPCGRYTEIDEELTLFSVTRPVDPPPSTNNTLYIKRANQYVHDDFAHEHSLLVRQGKKNVVFGGCAHVGAGNVMRQTCTLLGYPPNVFISGFHLFNPSTRVVEDPDHIASLCNYLLCNERTHYYTCHCTGIKAFKMMQQRMGDRIELLTTGDMLEL